MIPVGGIVNISGRIAEYFGLIEGVSTQVTKLIHQAFKSAKDNLEYAKMTSGQNQIDYIKRAKDRFIDAIAVEENENKVLALVGLSMCQYLLGDSIGAQKSLDRIDDVELSRAEITKYAVAQAGKYAILNPLVHLVSRFITEDSSPSLAARIKRFENTKNEAIKANRKLLQD